MLGIGSTAAVANQQYFFATSKSIGNTINNLCDQRRKAWIINCHLKHVA